MAARLTYVKKQSFSTALLFLYGIRPHLMMEVAVAADCGRMVAVPRPHLEAVEAEHCLEGDS